MVENLSDAVFKKHYSIIHASFKKFEEIKLPALNESIHLISLRNLNAIGLINYINSFGSINELYIVVYSINHPSALAIIDICKKNNIKCNMLISNIRNTAYFKKELAIKEFEKSEWVDITFVGSHAKLMLIQQGSKKYTCETSANLSPNSRIEQYVITQCDHLYIYHNEFKEVSNEDYCQIGTFPMDYNFEKVDVKYLIGMSVPPVMMAQIAYEIYLQWLRN